MTIGIDVRNTSLTLKCILRALHDEEHVTHKVYSNLNQVNDDFD